MRGTFVVGLVFVSASWGPLATLFAQQQAALREAPGQAESDAPAPGGEQPVIKPKPKNATKMVNRGVEWLINAQHDDGGWGGGSHAQQNVRDPSKFPSDPATTSFAAVALLKAGHTPTSGKHSDAVLAAVRYLVKAVDAAPQDSPKITTLTGTQPQVKLGAMIDTAMTAQFLTRVREMLDSKPKLRQKVNKALTECLRRLEETQKSDGSWGDGGGWAPVLQSAMNCSSLELARASGIQVDDTKVDRARNYQKSNVNAATGGASADKAAGVELYAFAGGFRGNAADASIAQSVINKAKDEGKLAKDAPVSEDNLRLAGQDAKQARELAEAETRNQAQIRRLEDETLLSGFGNNGGEEFLSYLMTSESLVIAGGKAWNKWNSNMIKRLGKVQNADGSWSGHHCITSPTFCTAAVLQVLTTDRDVKMLKRVAAANEKKATR
ncbi:MAG: prenyltransferase/squalene oxidase repeat-containing protein [Planctomycetota bacterium]